MVGRYFGVELGGHGGDADLHLVFDEADLTLCDHVVSGQRFGSGGKDPDQSWLMKTCGRQCR